ncbi:MAG: hypothetical protein E6230_05330 [Paenibacillus dendritiformis]|uniref:hypothetical protein n=1 Tax=Paenibacillus dendritiformis TaxID=130049 RepID=UPI00143CF337|nr:hypothetical protein [Paenibacillus dendritiformis]MDU5141595.1 hypothetical protein [Paenibacillus dendritiformis]NKI20873.1 hypothetical protein [Paenibacillus dendritiformis]NRG01098.1 hypothetical protein [Paenibacillus dendritiformis]GIO75398.1 hypothetical protein J27TS7_49120 [Paenibacillus dendritiformis]
MLLIVKDGYVYTLYWTMYDVSRTPEKVEEFETGCRLVPVHHALIDEVMTLCRRAWRLFWLRLGEIVVGLASVLRRRCSSFF